MRFGVLVATIGLGAFLLFQVQPMLGKQLLPWFGGTPAVWTTCLLWYQAFLLVGYLYAHWVVVRVRPARQVGVQASLVLLAVLTLPVLANPAWQPVDDHHPLLRIFLVLTVSAGLPYLLLAGTGTLLQAWCAARLPDRSPYPLYAVSNAGSLLGLLSYPLFIEPRLTLAQQANLWSALFVLWALGTVLAGWGTVGEPAAGAARGAVDLAGVAPAGPGERLWWLLLAACGTALLMAVTNQICIDVASLPFLWVLPLVLYLLTFIVAFARPDAYRRGLAGVLLALGLAAAWQALIQAINLSLGRQIAAFCGLLASGAWVCHGLLARSRPAPARLSEFYLMIAAGGVLGGLAVAVVAPLVFGDLYELQVVMVLVTLLYVADLWRDCRQRGLPPGQQRIAMVAGAASVATVAGAVAFQVSFGLEVPLAHHRSFYGVLRVVEETIHDLPIRGLIHGRTRHGWQIRTAAQGRDATSYYGPRSGVGLAMRYHEPTAGTRRIGAVGLGAGVLASYAEAGDTMTFYELDPTVEAYARRYFTFLTDATARGATVDVRLGDARQTLARELAAGAPGAYDLLVLDAFSSDAIPVHLLTSEAFDLYARHLATQGLVLVHVTNRHFDLVPVVRAQARRLGWSFAVRRDEGDGRTLMGTTWVWLGPAQPFFGQPVIHEATSDWADEREIPWRDDYSSLWPVLR